MINEQQKQRIAELGHDGMKALRDSIDPEAKYFTDYTIDNHGNRIEKTDVVEGMFLTEGQQLTAERIN